MNLPNRTAAFLIILCSFIFINVCAQEKLLYTKTLKLETSVVGENNVKQQPFIENKTLPNPKNAEIIRMKYTSTNANEANSLSSPNGVPTANALSQILFYGNTPSAWTVDPPGSGYVTGTNSYKDQGKYERFNFTGSATLSEVRIYFDHKTIVGTTNNFNLVVRSVGSDGAPSTILYTKLIGINNININSPGYTYNIFTIYPAVTVSSAFFVGVEWDPNIDDKFSIVGDSYNEGNIQKRAWEKDISGSYYDMYTNWEQWDSDLWIAAVINPVSTPTAPVLLQPANNATGAAINPTLSWNASSGATSYRLQVSVNSDFSTTVFDQSNITGTSQQVTGLSGNTTYYWHVNATNSAGTSSYSTAWSFTTVSGSVNLTPVVPNGWSDKIVVSVVTGGNIDATEIYDDQNIYIDWAVVNNGTSSTSVIFYTDLFIDGNKIQGWYTDPPINPNEGPYDLDFNIGKLSAGLHTIQITTDVTGVISESNESDNSYTKTITVLQHISNPQIQVTPTSLTINQPTTGFRSSTWVDNIPLSDKSVSQKPQDKKHTLGLKIPNSVVEYWKTHSPQIHRNLNKALTSVDWSSNDSAVKDQDVCGGCWAFSAIALVENLGTQKDLSEQVIISCSSDSSNCDQGGYEFDAFKYMKETGAPPEDCYPFAAVNGSCSNKCSNPLSLTKITGYSEPYGLWGEPANVNDIKAVLQNGPLVVSMKVPEDYSFQNYSGGIYHYSGGFIPWENNGHAVLIVGYNDDQRCFKVKNSWGTSWGENGYFRISYDDVTGSVTFGSYGYTVSGVYTNEQDNVFTVQNIGNANLLITSITSNKNWLSVTGVPSTPITLTPNGSQPATVNVDWALVTSSQDVGTITISSNDPTHPTIQVQVTANKASASLNVISPNGGENWSSGTQQNITWSYLNVTSIKIELTTDGGSSWFAPLVSSTPCDGSYTWKVPNYSSQQCKIKISDAGNGSLYDMSDNVFSIGSSPTITTSVNSIPDFGNIEVNTNSSAKSYTVSGNNLKGNVTITAPTGFQVSKQEQSGFANSISLTPTNTSLPSTTIYVRFSPTGVKSYDGNISHTSTDAVPQNIGVWGNGVPESENASISLVVSDNTICSNTEFWVEVKIGDPQTINDLYGISFKLTSNNNNCTYVDGSAVNGDFLGSSSLFVARAINNQTVDIGITKTSIPGVSGSGIIAKAKFKSSANISSNQTVIISLFDLFANNSAGNTISLIPATATITISASCNVEVWPGDCNNDGAVSAADLLPVGQYYGLQSQNSNNPGNQWQAYERNPWALDGTSPKRIYADANGDGKINSSDVLPIGLNYGKTHSSSGSVIPILAKTNESESGATPLTYPSLELVGPTEPIIGNTKFTIEVVVGENAEVTDLFGISFKIKCSSTTCNYVENSMKEGPFLGNNLLKFDKKIDEQTVDASITKTAAPGENGKGMIAAFDFISEVSQVVNFSLEDVSATDSQGNEIIFDVSNTSVIVDAKKDEELPNNYSLSQNYPNPFNPITCIKYQIPEISFVSLKVYDVIGNEIATLVNDEKSPGTYEVIFDGSNLQSGVYFYSIKSNSFTQTKKLLLLK